LLDFGRPDWFAGLDHHRAHYWDEPTAAGFRAALRLRRGLRLADIGCGWGFLGHLLLPGMPGGAVTGYDLEPELLELGRARARETGTRALRFVEADALALDDEGFDGAVAQTVLLHQSRPQAMVRAMADAVRPGGFVAVVEPDHLAAAALSRDAGATAEDVADELAVLGRLFEGLRAMGAGDYRVGGRLAPLFAEAGLAVESCWFHGPVRPVGLQDTPLGRWRRAELADEEIVDRWAGFEGAWAQAGGSDEAWSRWLDGRRRLGERQRRAVADGTWWSTWTAGLHVCVGRVPMQ
jgi:SAM-dependent methyltransferase